MLETSNNQRLEKGVQCVLLLYNWDLRVLKLITNYTDGHNLVSFETVLSVTVNELSVMV